MSSRSLLTIIVWPIILLGLLPLSSPAQSKDTEVFFPDLTGPYKVGRVAYDWIDNSRPDPYSKDPNAKRELVVLMWYPASPKPDALPAPYVDGRWWNAIFTDRPGLADRVHTHAYADAPISSAKASYPVVTFIHGGYVVPWLYTAMAEELASHGYIVVGTTHPYGSGAILYADGHIISGRGDTSSSRWTSDVLFVLAQLEALNADTSSNLFGGRMDLSHMGIMGHSAGGSTALEVSRLDKQIEAGVYLSNPAWVPTTKPFLFVTDSTSHMSSLPTGNADSYTLHVKGSTHNTWADLGLLAPLVAVRSGSFTTFKLGPSSLVLDLGTIDPVRAWKIANDYIVVFFDEYLKGSSQPWPSEKYPEAEFKALLSH